jgi:hypothetical protein
MQFKLRSSIVASFPSARSRGICAMKSWFVDVHTSWKLVLWIPSMAMGNDFCDTGGEVVNSTLMVGFGHGNGIISQIRIDFSIMVFILALLPNFALVLLSSAQSLFVLFGLLLCTMLRVRGWSCRGPAYYNFVSSQGRLSDPSPPACSSSNSSSHLPMADPTSVSLASVGNWGPARIEEELFMVLHLYP